MITSSPCTATEIADLLEVTPRRLQQLAAEGAIPKPAKRGQYELAPTVRGYIKFFKERADGKSNGYAYEKERLTRLQADTLQVELRESNKRWVPIELVDSEMSGICMTIRRHILCSSMTEDEKHDCLANLHFECVSNALDKHEKLRREIANDATASEDDRAYLLANIDKTNAGLKQQLEGNKRCRRTP